VEIAIIASLVTKYTSLGSLLLLQVFCTNLVNTAGIRAALAACTLLLGQVAQISPWNHPKVTPVHSHKMCRYHIV